MTGAPSVGGVEPGLVAPVREHRDQVATQIEQLTESLGTVNHKITAYGGQLAEGATGPIRCVLPQGD